MTDSDDPYNLTLKGGGLSIDREVTQAQALTIIQIAMGGETTPIAPPPPPASGGTGATSTGGGGTGSPSTTSSVGEYIDEVKANRNHERILAVGHFLEMQNGGSFTREDVRAGFEAARETLPQNFARDFNKAIANRWVAPVSGSRNDFHVLQPGIRALADQFATKPTGRKVSARRVKKAAKRTRAAKKS